MKKLNKNQKGFTLIEFLVAGSAFVIILSVVTLIIVRSMQVHNRMLAAESVNDEIRYVLDTISRAVRVSKIESGGASLVLSGHPTKGDVSYTLAGGIIQENNKDITSSSIVVDILNFTDNGIGFEGFGIGAQPRVTLTIKARSSNPVYSSSSEILVQTTVEQKTLDVAVPLAAVPPAPVPPAPVPPAPVPPPPVPGFSLVGFTFDTDYIEEDAVDGTDIQAGEAVLHLGESLAWRQWDVTTGVGVRIINSVIYANGKYIAGGRQQVGLDRNAAVWESEDLDNSWTVRSVDEGAGEQIVNSIIYDSVNNKYVAGGIDNNDAVVWESPDLVSWTQRNVDLGIGTQSINSIIYANGRYIAGGRDGAGVSVWESLDLVSWSEQQIDFGEGTQYIYSIIYADGRYVAGGYDNGDGVVWVSPDLVSWEQKNVDDGWGAQYIYSIIYANGRYVAGGRDDLRARVWVSPDAESWTQRDIDYDPNVQWINSIVYGDGRYVAGGHDQYNAIIWETENLEYSSWSAHYIDAAPFNQQIYSIIYANGRYVAGGYDVNVPAIWEIYEVGQYPLQAYYVTTSDAAQLDTSDWVAIINVVITQSEPANTSLKYLVSFDGRATWKYWNGSAWINSSLASLQIDGMTEAQMEAMVEADWSGAGGFEAGTTLTLDFAVDLRTTDTGVTPSIDEILVNYES